MTLVTTLIISILLSLGLVNSSEDVNDSVILQNQDKIDQYIDSNEFIVTGDIDVL